jgi:hypothetical protein
MSVTWIDSDPLAFILHFLKQFWIACRLVCCLYEAMKGSLPVANIAVWSAKVAVVECSEVGRSVVYRRYINDPSSVYSGETEKW